MANQDFYLILGVLILSILAVMIYWRKAYRTPIYETKIFGFAFITNFVSSLLAFLSVSIISTDFSISLFAIRLSYVFVSLTGILIISAFFFPSVNDTNYQDFIVYGFSVVIFALTGYENLNHLNIEIVNSSIKLVLTPNAIILQAIAGMILIIFIAVRYNQVNTLSELEEGRDGPNSKIRIVKLILFISVYIILTFLSIIISRFFNSSSLSWFVLSGLFFIFLSILMARDISFFFITKAKLESVIVFEHSSGLSLYSQNFRANKEIEVLISSLLTALNISLKDMIKSSDRLKEISFGDKTIIIAPNTWTTTLLIVSEKNFVTMVICKYLGKKFEKFFDEKKDAGLVKINDYQLFDNVINEIRQYIPF